MSFSAAAATGAFLIGVGLTIVVLGLVSIWSPAPAPAPAQLRYRWVLNGVSVSAWRTMEIRTFKQFMFRFTVDPWPDDAAEPPPAITLRDCDALTMELEILD